MAVYTVDTALSLRYQEILLKSASSSSLQINGLRRAVLLAVIQSSQNTRYRAADMQTDYY